MRTRHFRWLPVFLGIWLGLIFGTSCTVIRPHEFFLIVQNLTGAGPVVMEGFAAFWGVAWFMIVKGWHFLEFAILMILCVKTVAWREGRTTPRTLTGSALFCMLFAVTDEWHQTFVPDRYGSGQDVLIDCLGVLTATANLLPGIPSQRTVFCQQREDQAETSIPGLPACSALQA